MYRNDEGPTEEGVGCVFVPAFILLCALLIWSLGCASAQASEEPPCAPGLIHYLPYCLTEAEYVALTAPPPPPIVPAPVWVPAMGVEHWRAMVAYYWPAWTVDRMLRIMKCESGGDPNAWNKSTDVRGLFQVRYPIWSKPWPGNYFDPWTNAAIAYQVWLTQGFSAWACKGYL